ncbi:MAG TPA: hypothetical protein PLC59_02625 [Bacteroidales bacterium]|nr:hypothetical protein [Bacteroidales bacterium]HQI44950.1 hypothetical protein [Bacteroidales bacterium]
MTKSEKLTVIRERLKINNDDIDEKHISIMVIMGYLNALSKAGLIESAWNIKPKGDSIIALCEEFDWKPDDEEIRAFVEEMINPYEKSFFMFLLKRYRDDREGLIGEFKKNIEKLEAGEVIDFPESSSEFSS